jgi:hypothetical protein
MTMLLTWGFGGALGGTRTPNLLIRSQMLYPLSYERRLNPRQCTALGTLPAGASFRAGWHPAALSWAGRLAGHRGHSTRELVVAVMSGRHWPTS